MNIREYLDAPMGKGDVGVNRSIIKSHIEKDYLSIIHGEKKKKITMTVFWNPRNDAFYFWLVIPTVTDRTNTYDLVFRFRDTKKQHRKELSIINYDIQVFSNTPSFAYTYAYVYAKEKFIIEELSPKLGDRIIKNPPKVRNRYKIMNYDKYLYIGARYILESKKLNRVILESIAKPYNEKYLFNNIRSLSTIMTEYDVAAQKLRQKKVAQKNATMKDRNLGDAKKSSYENGVNVISKRTKNSHITKIKKR